MEGNKFPQTVPTELGEATVGIVSPKAAIKEFLCPLCNETILIGEQHVIVVPLVKSRLRRHIHSECLSANLRYNVSIILHPNERSIAHYYF